MINHQFLDRIMCDVGPYCLWTARRKMANGAPTKELVDRKQEFYADLPALISDASVHLADDREVYFAMASFKTEGTRETANIRGLKCFFFDLDCRPGKEYSDKKSAIDALRNFCTRNALPKPVLVDSGGGIHGYWVLDREVSYAEWAPVAERYKAACLQQGFRMDMSVPADGARILRLPGTLNFKDAPASPVTMLLDSGSVISFEDFAAKFEGITAKPKTFVPAKFSAVAAQLMGNTQNNFRKILTRPDSCAQLLHAVTNQADIDEPLWRATLSIAAHCEDAAKAIHAVSREHPQYDPQATEDKASRIKGPYLCSRFDEYNPGVCAGCPHFGKIKSPIVLGKELHVAETEEERTVEVLQGPQERRLSVPAITIVIPKPPHPYVRGASGGVYRQGKDEDGNPKDELVYHHDLYVTRRVYDPEKGDSVVIRLHLPRDGVREFSVPQGYINAADKLQAALSAMGVTARGKAQWTAIGYYIMDYVDDLQARESADLAHRQFGWTEGFKSFVIGTREYMPGGIVRHSPPTDDTKHLVDFFTPRGTLDQWKKLMQFFNNEGMELHQLVVCTAFGSPLMEFSPIYSMLLHLNGPTGFGKTTTQWAAAGVYGKPDGLMIRHDDTTASKFHRFEIMKNLPIYIDELTKCAPIEASDLAYSLSAGRQRNRMSSGSNAERHRGDPWHLSSVSSGNASVMDMIEAAKADPDAERERVFEVSIKEYVYPHSKEDSDTFQSAISKDVYGVAAEPYLQWLVDNTDEAREFFLATQQRLDAAAGLISKNRMVSAGFAAHLAGGMIAKKLGLIQFDMKRVFNLVVKLIRERYAYLEATKKQPIDYIVQYVSENYNNILRINGAQDLRGKADKIAETFVIPEATPRGELVARYEPDTKRLFIVPKPFKTWCVKQQLNAGALMQEIAKVYPYEYRKVHLSKGTKLQLPKSDVHIIEFSIEEHVDVKAAGDAG